MKNFIDKNVIITGASSGIGEALAYEFVKVGAKLTLAARRIERLEAIQSELQAKGYEVLVVKTDVSIEDDCKNMVDQSLKHYGHIDLLINNAGISMRANFIDVDLSVIRRLMDVNFWGTVYCTKYALPELLKSKGVVVGVSSVAGFHGLPGRTGYSASKFAMHGFLETIRIENLKKGLHVMIIAPGFTSSEVRLHALLSDGSAQGATPRKEDKMMTPKHVAKILISSIRKKKRNRILTMKGKLTALLQRIVPEQVDAIYYSAMAKEPDSPLEN